MSETAHIKVNAEYLLEAEPELKLLCEKISSKNTALNAAIKLLTVICEKVDLTSLNKDSEFIQLNMEYIAALQKL